jgi:hypothetical protein
MPFHYTYLRTTAVLASYLHLSLPSGLFPSGVPTKNLSALSPGDTYLEINDIYFHK